MTVINKRPFINYDCYVFSDVYIYIVMQTIFYVTHIERAEARQLVRYFFSGKKKCEVPFSRSSWW